MAERCIGADWVAGVLQCFSVRAQQRVVRTSGEILAGDLPDPSGMSPKDHADALRDVLERGGSTAIAAVFDTLREEGAPAEATVAAILTLHEAGALDRAELLADAWQAVKGTERTRKTWRLVPWFQAERLFQLARTPGGVDSFVERVVARCQPDSSPLAALQAMVRSLCILPTRLDPDPAQTLDKVTVELLVDGRSGANPSSFAPLSHNAADRALSKRPAGCEVIQFRELLTRPDKRWVVLGVPGSGKSTALRRLALLEDTPQPCVLLRVVDLEDGGLESAVERLAAGAWTDVHQKWSHGVGCLLIDGLDEAGLANTKAMSRVTAIAKLYPHLRIVLTSRPVAYQHDVHSSFQRVRLRPLTEVQQVDLLAIWLGRGASASESDLRARAAADLEAFGRHPRLRELCGTPLVLALIGLVRCEHPDRALPAARAALYTEVLRVLLGSAHRAGLAGDPVSDTSLDSALEVLADVAVDVMLAQPANERERASLVLGNLHKSRRTRREQDGWLVWGDRLDRLLRHAQSGGLLEGDPRTRRWSFTHRTLLEVLAARALVRDFTQGDGGLFGRALEAGAANPARWAEVFALMPGLEVDGQTIDSDALVAQIQETGNRALLHQVLVDADDLSEETVWQVLDFSGGRDRWVERAKRWEQLPQLVGHKPGIVLGLVERYVNAMAAGTRPHHGVDLWFMGWLCDRVATSDVWGPEGDRLAPEALRKQAGVVKGKRFAHISKEQRETAVACLTRLGTRLFPNEADPLAAIWRPIPAGVGWMGSAEGEGHRDERPQLRVDMGPGLLMLAVPVTLDLFASFDPAHVGERDDFNGMVSRGDDGELPVYNVSWWEASVFAEWVANLRPAWAGCRLPLEEEWEYACRAWLEELPPPPWHSGATEKHLNNVAWTDRNAGAHPHRVGHREGNAFGLFDLHGNVDEWCASQWTRNHSARTELAAESRRLRHAPTTNVPLPTTPSARRVFRGGSWGFGPGSARAAYRGRGHPSDRSRVRGFRLVLAPPA